MTKSETTTGGPPGASAYTKVTSVAATPRTSSPVQAK